jgi:hypothetical protein
MAKPNEAYFKEWFDLEKIEPASGLLEGLEERLTVSPNPSTELREKLAEALELLNRHYARCQKSDLAVWTESQPGYRKAWEELNRRRRRKDEEISVVTMDWADRIIRNFESVPRHPHFSSQLRSYFLRSLKRTWLASVFHALHEYHFTDRAEQLYGIHRKRDEPFEKLRKSFDEVLAVIKQSALGGATLSERIERDERMFQRMQIWDYCDDWRDLPIRRNSKHKAEQLFVYRAWQANQRHVGKPKPEVIVELMTFDGFGHQFDLRTVARMCAKFNGAKAQRTSRKMP